MFVEIISKNRQISQNSAIDEIFLDNCQNLTSLRNFDHKMIKN